MSCGPYTIEAGTGDGSLSFWAIRVDLVSKEKWEKNRWDQVVSTLQELFRLQIDTYWDMGTLRGAWAAMSLTQGFRGRRCWARWMSPCSFTAYRKWLWSGERIVNGCQ